MLIKKIKEYIEENQLIQSGDRVILAVSGGPDSMALLYMMHHLSPRLGFEIIAAHLNHGLRAAADDEEAFVIRKCRSLGVVCYSRTAAVTGIARERKTTLEDAGRYARYKYFDELREELNAQKIATAHHCDDVAETVLLHLLRGSGIKGLRGILPVNGALIRPLLSVSKAELRAFLSSENIPYCLDQSNDDTHYLRNRIRHGLIPYLQNEFNPEIIGKLNQLANIARDEFDVLNQECAALWGGLVEREDDHTVIMKGQVLKLLHRAYQRRMILQAFSRLAGESGWSLEDVEKVLELSRKQGSSLTLQLKNQVRVNKSYDKMIFTTRPGTRVDFSHPITVPGRVEIAETGRTYLISQVNQEDYQPEPGDIYLDYDKLPDPLYLRSRREGDIFRPVGMSGSKKLKKFLIDLKVPYFERDRIPLLAGAGPEIYAALDLGVSRTVAVTPATRSILLIKNLE